jgi:hypothetical protein
MGNLIHVHTTQGRYAGVGVAARWFLHSHTEIRAGFRAGMQNLSRPGLAGLPLTRPKFQRDYEEIGAGLPDNFALTPVTPTSAYRPWALFE